MPLCSSGVVLVSVSRSSVQCVVLLVYNAVYTMRHIVLLCNHAVVATLAAVSATRDAVFALQARYLQCLLVLSHCVSTLYFSSSLAHKSE